MTRKDFVAAAAGAVATFAAASAAFAQPRGEVASAVNMVEVRRACERLIDQLQHDQRDYGGWRVRAIVQLQQARADILRALEWDATHPH